MKLYAVRNESKSPRQLAREAVTKFNEVEARQVLRSEPDLRCTVREGAGMHVLPSTFRFWWKAPVIRPEKGLIQKNLYGK